MSNILTVHNLSKMYSANKGIKNVSFALEKGSILGIIGLNGAGKTTLLSCLTGFMDWDAGEIAYAWDDRTFHEVDSDVLDKLGIIASEYGFPGHFTARMISKIMNNTYKNWDSLKFNDIIEEFNLEPQTKIKKYSTGMKSALAIAIALSHNAKILILDEATRGLDIKASAKLRDLLYAFMADGEKSIILTSHIMSDIEKMSDTIILIDEGTIKFNCNKDDLLHQYKVFPVTTKQLEDIEQEDLTIIKREDARVRVIAKDPKVFSEKYAIDPERLPLDKIIEIFLEGESVS